MANVKRRILQGFATAVLLVLVLGIAAPFLRANRYRDLIQTALSDALGRKVTLGEVRLDLFTGPGFSIENVTIAGANSGRDEPFAYVAEVRAVPRIWSLWTGALEFSSLTLEDAHVNLTRTDTGWNYESLLRPGLLAAFPTLRLRGARINFKTGDWKSRFYLLDTDLDVAPLARDGSAWQLRFTGEPARTDRPAHGFGSIQANGRWSQAPGASARIAFDLNLERSEIGDVVSLVSGRDAGVRGIISGKMHIAGPVMGAGIEGELRVSELHGWAESPPPGGVFVFRVSGLANTQTQHLDLNAEPRSSQAALKAHLIGDGYLDNGYWRFDAHSAGLPVARFPGLLRNFGVPIPENLRLSGSVQGDLSYSAAEGWKGNAVVSDASLQAEGVAPISFRPASLSFSNGAAHLDHVEIESGDRTVGAVTADYSFSDGAFDVNLSSNGGPLSAFLNVFPAVSVPLLSTLQKGNWKGDLRYSDTPAAPKHWSGLGELTDAQVVISCLATTLEISTADVHLDDGAIEMDRMKLSAGGTFARGEYRYIPLAPRPHQFHLSVDAVDSAQLETLFRPVLYRGPKLLEMALGRSPVPDWLRNLRADGFLQIGTLLVAGTPMKRLHTHIQWDGPQIAFADLQSALLPGSVSGRAAIDARDYSSRYVATLRLNGMEWQGGAIEGNLRLRTAGNGLDLLANLMVSGSFSGRDLEVPPIGVVDEITGEFEASWNGQDPQFRFAQLRLISGDNTWIGSGVSQSSSQVAFRLSTGTRKMNLVGSLTNSGQPWVQR